MNPSPLKSDVPTTNDPRAIPKWTRTYAQNRTLGVVAFMFIFLALFAGISGSSYLAGQAYRSGNLLLLGVSVVVLVASLAAICYISVPRWGGKLQQRVMDRLYAKEGNVALAAPTKRSNTWIYVLAVGYAACIIATVMLESLFEVPSKYIQPITALYVVPFLVALWFLMRPMVGRAALIWPAMYAAHALLILAGAPIVFSGSWAWLNLLLPIVGYGLLAALVGHLVSRLALRQLKTLAQTNVTNGGEELGDVGD